MQEVHHTRFWASKGWCKVAQFKSLKSRFLRTISLETEFSNFNVFLPHSERIDMRTKQKTKEMRKKNQKTVRTI